MQSSQGLGLDPAAPAEGGRGFLGWRRLLSGPWPYLLLVVAGLTHRIFLFFSWRPDLDALLAQNSDYLTWQFLAVPALRDHLGASLLYLQQSPPLPNLILGLLLHVVEPPFGLTYALLALQTLIAVGSACLLFHLLRQLLGRHLVALAFALLFLLGPDLLFLEYNSFGQSFYENLTQLLLLALAAALGRALREPSLAATAVVGFLAGVLPLTRATFSYLPFVFALLVLCLPLRPRRRHLAVYAALAFGLPGLWAVKQLAVYGAPRWATSSWAGANAVQGLVKAGYEAPFRAHLDAHPERYPGWFHRLIAAKGLVDWRWVPQPGDLPAEILERDRAIQDRLHGTNRKENSLAQAAVFDVYARAWKDFLLEHPAIALRKLYLSTRLFFFPIRYHGAPFLRCEWKVDPFRPWQTGDQLRRGELPEKAWLATGTGAESRPARTVATFTLDRASIVWQILLLWGLPLLLPWRLWRLAGRLRRGSPLSPADWVWLAALLLAASGGLVANLVEYGENQRFRLAVEPLLWLLALGAVLPRPPATTAKADRSSPSC